MTVISILLRHPIAQAVGRQAGPWAAALGIPAGCLYLLLCILRGVLQGIGDYKSVGISLIGEQAARLVIGAVLAGVGLGVTGAYLGSPLSFVAMCSTARCRSRRQLGARRAGRSAGPLGLGTHVCARLGPIAALAVIAVLQNIDVIAAKHRFSTHAGQLLQRHRRRREGADLGGHGRRLLPRPRGLPPARRGRGHAARARQGARHHPRGRHSRACSSTHSPRTC